MSLFNNVAANLKENLKEATTIASGIKGAVSGISSAVSGVKGAVSGIADSAMELVGDSSFGSALVQGAQGVAMQAASGLVNKYIPASAQKIINTGIGAGKAILSGDWNQAGMELLSSGLIGQLFPGMRGVSAQFAYWGVPTPLFGGISPTEAKRIYDEIKGENLAKKNLWLLEVTSALSGGNLNIPSRFNMFATSIEYTPFTVNGDKVTVGASNVDLVNSCGPVEMNISTLDDQDGSLKRWFAMHHSAAAASDGTVGEPGKYAIRIKIVHSFIEENDMAYADVGLFRTESLSHSLSRREDDLQELQMTFSQLDTFMRA